MRQFLFYTRTAGIRNSVLARHKGLSAYAARSDLPFFGLGGSLYFTIR